MNADMKADMNAENNSLVSLSNAMADAVEKAGAYTVLVDARRRLPATGVAYSSDLVLTADHVVERDEDIHLLLPNGEQADASIAGRDPGNDLVLLRLKDKILTAAEPAPQPASLGQIALAVGRPTPEGLQVSLGVVSAIGGSVRTGRGGLLEQYLRTDAIPYPGFSGGPLIDAAARVLGINTSGAARGVSLTIPAGLAWGIADSLAKHGHIRRGFLGVRSQAVELPAAQSSVLKREQSTGLLLQGVEENSPASQGGLMIGDILVGLAGQSITDPDQLLSSLAGDIVGRLTPLEILRGGQLTTVQVKIGERQ